MGQRYKLFMKLPNVYRLFSNNQVTVLFITPRACFITKKQALIFLMNKKQAGFLELC